jgi:benzil reductase ((S)-benzoin forming)
VALTAPNYRFVACDLADTINIDAVLTPAFRAIADARSEFLCLINNAATAGPVGTIGSLEAGALTASMGVNVVAPIAIANLFCRMFLGDAQVRRIVNVSSGAADSPLPGGGPYSIAKAGLEMLTRQLAAEHDAATFRAITVRPGVIDTDMQMFMRSQTHETLPSVDLFKGFHREHRLVAPETVAGKIVDKLILGDVEQGRTYNYREL